MPRDATRRFSGVSEHYVRHRPHYPREVVTILEREIGLAADWMIADVGSGTGISAELFLDNGNTVFAVEPNAEMRVAAERRFRDEPRFRSVAGAAEATGLPADSVDLVVAAQAFHWFDSERTRTEFIRILRRDGWVVLLWNKRIIDTTPFLRAYEDLLMQFGTDYVEIRHDRRRPAVIEQFFRGPFQKRVLHTEQVVDLEGLRGRLLSTSYIPAPDRPEHPAMLHRLDEIFRDTAIDGRVRFDYDVELYWGRLAMIARAGSEA
jgi:SAM-dependent methyltransferase